MGTNLVNIGFGNMVVMNRVIGMTTPKAAPIKLLLGEARNKGMLINMTNGRKSKTAIFIDTGHIMLSSVELATIASRTANEEEKGAQHADS